MKKLVMLALFAISVSACSNEKKTDSSTATDSTATTTTTASAAQPENITPSLQKVWETDTVLTTVESTLYDATSGSIYTSNIEGGPNVKDGKGSISKLKPDGTIEQVKWVTGLNAPKGMAVLNGKLYVTDVDQLVEINIADGKISNRYPVKGAKFLNDAATDGSKVYFSDMETGKVHMLENGKVGTLTEGMTGINGLAFNGKGNLFVLDSKGLRQYNMQDKNTSAVNEVVTGGDGLVVIDDSTYIASRWQGEIYLVKNGKEHLLLDTKGESSNTADIDYIKDQKLVLVPTFMKNKVVAYKLNY
jgi:sugar lactone lactonase YvrE